MPQGPGALSCPEPAGFYGSFMRNALNRIATLRLFMILSATNLSVRRPYGRRDLSGGRGGGVRRLRRARRSIEAGVTMIGILWGAGAVVVAIYMVVALLRPERF